MTMSESQFQRYWNRIDNSPGALDRATPEQLAEVKRMVKAAFHAGHGMYQKRIAELETSTIHAKYVSAMDRISELEANIFWYSMGISKGKLEDDEE